MVLPHAPIISVGTSQAGSKENGEVAVHSLITDIRGEGDVHSIEVRMSSRSKENGRSVHVEQEAIGAGESEGVRSMYSERACQNQHRHMDVRLRSAALLDDTEMDLSPYDSLGRFVDGDFASGIVKNISLPTGCWTMAFSTRAEILATGLRNRVEFLEARNFTLLYSLPQKDKVSAIHWCPGSAFSPTACTQKSCKNIMPHHSRLEDGELVAVAGLDGHVGVYHLDASLLELKGTQIIHEFEVGGQVRCMAFKSMRQGGALLAVGDKQGKITLVTLYRDNSVGHILATVPIVVDFEGDAVLCLDCHLGDNPILAAGTKSGKVVIHELLLSTAKIGISYMVCGKEIWRTERNGNVRAVVISDDGIYLSFGGYDKTLIRVNVRLLAIVRELTLEGTINTIAFDPLDRFMVVGCRDKSLTIFDTSTYFPIKRLQTPGWVTSISWGLPGIWSDIVAIRSENKGIALLDLTPNHMTDIQLPSKEGFGSSVSWTPCGNFLARVSGESIHIVDSRCAFTLCAQIQIPGNSFRSIAFSPKYESPSLGEDGLQYCYKLAGVGLDGRLCLIQFNTPDNLTVVHSISVEENLWTLRWSADGKYLATGGKGKSISLFSADGDSFKLVKTTKLDGRVWDIGFIPKRSETAQNENVKETCAIAIASGDYKTIFFDMSLRPTLQVVRSRTVRCLDYHPRLPLLAIGDGAGFLAIVDYRAEETIREVEIGGRVNVLQFSPAGDCLLVGSDDCTFTLYETTSYKVVQEFSRQSFALSGSFSPSGKYLALGSANEPYAIMRMGALLGIDLVPLDDRVSRIPEWALKQTLFRSGFGPSLVQRHMMRGNQDSLLWVSTTLKDNPDAIYTLNRHRNEGCLETALRLRKVKLLQVSIKTLVDGSLERSNGGKRSILTTQLPEVGKKTLEAMLASHPEAMIVEILQSLTFVKVPFSKPHVIPRERKMVCASSNYLDPWEKLRSVDDIGEEAGEVRIPAVLPIPGLGSMQFLSALVAKAPATAFDNEAMGVVLRVMWQNHIRKYYVLDTCIFVSYYALWILLIEASVATSTTVEGGDGLPTIAIGAVVLVLNSMFAVKELVQSNFGRRSGYFSARWNLAGIASIILVYVYSMAATLEGIGSTKLVPLAVITTLLLTMKLISYLRAFNQTGWLVTVLSRNFWDVRGFLVVLLSIIVGFSASFRLLFASSDPVCELELDQETDELVQACFGSPFGSLRRAILSTFELTILGSYEPALLHESPHTTLSILVFVLAVTCVLVVALNALISLLADSYARVQEDATANQRREKAELIVEYMSILPRWRRYRLEKETRFFHALLEADADGDLVVDDDDWHGGLNALRDDIEESNKIRAEVQLKAMENLKSDFEKDLASFRIEMMALLQDLADDIKVMKQHQNEAGVTISGKHVAGAVKAVREIRRKGTSIFKSPKNKDED